MKLKNNIVRAALYVAVGCSTYALSSSAALAWGNWSDWTAPGDTSICEDEGVYCASTSCVGISQASGSRLDAFITGYGGSEDRAQAQAQGWGTTVIDDVIDSNSVSTYAPGTITAHRCHCEGTYILC